MRFLALTVNSFGPLRYGPVTLPLARQGLVLVEGRNLDNQAAADSNGAGKSLLFEAIPWALWGKMPRYGDRNVVVEACHPVHGADVAVDLEVLDAQFRVHRKKTGGAAKVRVFTRRHGDEEWQPLEGSALHAADGDLAGLLGFTYDTFRSALFLQATGFNVTTGGYAAQLRLLESVLRFDLFAEAGDAAKGHVTALDRGTLEARTRLTAARAAVEAATAELTGLGTLDETVTRAKVAAILAALEAELARYPTDVAVQLASASASLREAYAAWTSAVNAQHQASRLLLRLTGLASTAVCATCLQAIDGPRLEAQVVECRAALAARDVELAAAVGAHAEAQARHQVLEDQERTVRQLDVEIGARRRELAGIDGRQAQRRALLDQATARVAAAQTQAEALEGDVAQLTRETELARFWSRAFTSGDGLKGEVLGAATPVLNAAAARYGDQLTDGALPVEFNALRGKKTEDLIRLRDGRKYDGLSSGEKRRVDVIVALSLRALARWRLARPVNVGLMDEVFDALDETGLSRVVSVVQQDMEELETLFVITHRPSMKVMLPGARVWRVVRQGGTARVEVE